MKQLLIRADDIGYSYAVNLGISRSIHDGLVRSAGLMPNMPEAQRGWDWVKDVDIAIGQHTNVCLGKPCADPSKIPSLLGPDGNFHSSREYRAKFKEGEELVDFDECVIEIEAQLERFRAIVGHDPDYFEAHAVMSKNLFAAIHAVAEKHGLREQPFGAGDDQSQPATCGQTPVYMAMGSMAEGYRPAEYIKQVVEGMNDGDTTVVVCHPGYLDQFILHNSSLTEPRTREVDALIDPELRAWLEAQPDLKLVDYRDL